jgi:hypothetical protein
MDKKETHLDKEIEKNGWIFGLGLGPACANFCSNVQSCAPCWKLGRACRVILLHGLLQPGLFLLAA